MNTVGDDVGPQTIDELSERVEALEDTLRYLLRCLVGVGGVLATAEAEVTESRKWRKAARGG